jgi:hypothetical protein
MKIAATIIALLAPACSACADEKSAQAFFDFRPKVVAPFGIVEAQTLADAKRAAVYGVCGMSIFKEKKGLVWIFETKVGYGGSRAPDISVIEPHAPLPSFGPKKEEPKQSLDEVLEKKIVRQGLDGELKERKDMPPGF